MDIIRLSKPKTIIPYLSAHPVKATEADLCPLKFTKMTATHAAFWDLRVQPTIRLMKERADRNWSWMGIMYILGMAQAAKGDRPYFMTLVARNTSGKPIPVGMAMVLGQYPLPIGRPSIRDSSFVFFLTTMPRELFETYSLPPLSSLGRAILDGAVVYSWNLGNEGRLGLHAARIKDHSESHERLYRFYKEKCGMSVVGEDEDLPYNRKNDGRFFYFTPGSAAEFMAENSRWSDDVECADLLSLRERIDGSLAFDVLMEIAEQMGDSVYP